MSQIKDNNVNDDWHNNDNDVYDDWNDNDNDYTGFTSTRSRLKLVMGWNNGNNGETDYDENDNLNDNDCMMMALYAFTLSGLELWRLW